MTLPAKSTLRRSNRAAPRPVQHCAEADASQPETSSSVAQERRPKRKAAEQCLIMGSSSSSDYEAVTEVESDKESEMDTESSDDDHLHKHADPYHDGDSDEDCD